MEIEHGGRKGYRVSNPIFEPRELRLMIDSVQSARFITEAEATSITSKIKDLSDIYTRPSLERNCLTIDCVSNMHSLLMDFNRDVEISALIVEIRAK